MNNNYTNMQKQHYDTEAKKWSLENKDPVVGTFDLHNAWTDYDEYLFLYQTHGVALDFACGPGRNIVKFQNRFDRIDGVDISEKNIENAKIYIEHSGISVPNLYACNGVNLNTVPSHAYDTVFSTIAMQHICVRDIRYNYFKEFHRVLKSHGHIAIQMGFGGSSRPYSKYHDNNYNALSTNGGYDISIEHVEDLKRDLEEIGFVDFQYVIRPTGPGDFHKNWIYFNAKAVN